MMTGSGIPLSSVGEDPGAPAPRRRSTKVRLFLVLAGIVVALVLVSPLLLRRMDYFRVRRVEVVGARYIQPNVLIERLKLDSTTTIWEPMKRLTARVAGHPQVRDVAVSRKLPGTLVIRVVEILPVALIPISGVLRPVDRLGNTLPLDPSRTSVDLPIVAAKDTNVLAMLDDLQKSQPKLFARVSEIRWDQRGGMSVFLPGLTVRAMRDCTAARFAEIIPVEQDLERRGRRAAELDLRFRDQVVARVE